MIIKSITYKHHITPLSEIKTNILLFLYYHDGSIAIF